MTKLSSLFGFLCLFSVQIFGQIGGVIPSSNFPASGTWQSVAGVPGGIDQYSTNYAMFCNVKMSIPGTTNVAYGDGLHDDTSALQYAVAHCPNNECVYVPTGHYLTTASITVVGTYNYDLVQHPFSMIIRGDGPTNTVILNNAAGGEIISFKCNSGPGGNVPIITSGDSRGSTNMNLASMNAIGYVGQSLLIQHVN